MKVRKEFRSEIQQRIFAKLFVYWTAYHNDKHYSEFPDQEVNVVFFDYINDRIKNHLHLPDGWQDITNYKDLKKWYLAHVNG
jgi:hypothetical protein